jgi:hypothetical protein
MRPFLFFESPYPITELLLHVYSDRWVGIYTFGGGLFPPDGYIRPVVTTSRTDLDYKIYLLLKFTVPK